MLTMISFDILYMQKNTSFTMKSRQLLSIVFSLIMFTGVTAGSAAFAESDDYDDKHGLDDKLDRYCEMTDQEKRDFISEHDKASTSSIAKMNEYCLLDEDARDAYIEEHKDDYRMNYDKDIRGMIDRYCEMSDQEKRDFISEHDKAEDHVAKMNEYCLLDEDARNDYIKDHREEYKSNMKGKMMDNGLRPHMDYDRLCELSETNRALKIDDPEKLDRISEWCDMTPEERDTFKQENLDSDKKHDFDRMSDMAKDRMSDVAKDKLHDKAMKFSDESKRLKAMIMDKRDVSDDRMDEIKMKFEEKYGLMSTSSISDIKMKYQDHMATIKVNMSDERKTAIHDRVAEMKAFKAELRDRSTELTNEEKQELRADFIEKAKDMQLAWISPRVQMSAGVDSADVECREGFSLVMKESNGVAMCLKADTALKMIDRGIAVPAN